MEVSGISSGQLKDQFLTLLVTQLQNQDPIEPVKQEDFIGQLAQFSTVEGIENLNARFSDMLFSQQMLNGFDLAGKEISYILPGDAEPRKGYATEVLVEDGTINVVVGQQKLPISQVVGVHAPTATTP